MASGKKGKKTKGKTIALTEFLQDTPGSLPTQPVRKSTTSWADEVDEYDAIDSKSINVVLPTAPKASRDYDDIASKVPKEAPFMAYLSNLPYDVDEEDITDFFRNLKIVNMRIPKDERSGETPKLKGYGYVEFADRDSLLSALIIPDTNLKNRRIRIEVATNTENDRRRGGRMMGDRMGSADTGGDWRSSNRPEPSEDRRDRGGFNRDREGGFNRDREGGFNRDREGGSSSFTREGMRDPGRDRDQGTWRDNDRSSSYNDRYYRCGNRERDDRDDRRGGFKRFDDKDRNGTFTRSNNRGDRDDRESDAPPSEPRQRPKLNLAPRTKPLEQVVKPDAPAVPTASIFGNAKPVDTAERERQIEEKLLKEKEERLTENVRDRPRESADDRTEERPIERGRPTRREDQDSYRDKDINNKERGPPSRERRRDESGDDNRRPPAHRSEHKSPENKRKVEKQERPKQREEKKDRPEKDMPKFQEPEAPNFQGSNKFAALLGDDEDAD
ncbi:eukaryotic translation initiation factor 4B [Anthonomus grandis grandis]|uniref:eukaryotic translation initiation factor 4B n=1 Tax=Anthonomus grandis grandis TaxID=2921223 RepID=UPI0021669A81|nr:eukaryotic translation initiation factor 4B [Anthonomus grandis grandis]